MRETVKVMTELLAADHLKPAPLPELEQEFAQFNELGDMSRLCGADVSRFRLNVLSNHPPEARPPAGASEKPGRASSPVFLVDHDACILCDRCIRGCDDVRENHVFVDLDRQGRASAGISFWI